MSLDSKVTKHTCPCGDGTYSAYYTDTGFRENYSHSMDCVNCSTEYVLLGEAPNDPEIALWAPKKDYEAVKAREKISSDMRKEALTDAQKKCFDVALEYVKEEKSKKGMHRRLQDLCEGVPSLRKISVLSHEYIDEPLAEYFNFESIRKVFRTLGVSAPAIELKIQAVEAYDAATAQQRRDLYDAALRDAK